MDKTQLMLVGIDAADGDLIAQWAGQGYLPNFRRLLDEAASIPTQNPLGLYVGAVWPSFYTGLSPANHARYCFRQLVPGTYDTRLVQPTDVFGTPFWQTLSDAGQRVAVIDVPKSAAARKLNGIHIVDWGTHDPNYDVAQVYPAELAQDIAKDFGSDAVGNCNAQRKTTAEFRSFTDALIARIHKKTELSLRYLNQGGWDLFLTCFSESHCVGHQCWHLHDPDNIKHQQDLAGAVGDPMLQVYVAIDAGLGRLLDAVGPNVPTLVLASHGFQSHYDASFMLDKMLARLEHGVPLAANKGRALMLRRAWRQLPHGLKRPVNKLANSLSVGLGTSLAVKTLAQRRAYAVPNNDAWGGIRVNLAGREPEGRVQRADLDDFCEALTRDLLSFTNVDTGEPVVLQVIRTGDHYQGEHLDYLPDMLVEWERSYPISRVTSAKTGLVEGTYMKCRTGDHRPAGLLLAYGPGVPAGRQSDAVSVMDFAPSIAQYLNVELPRTDGRSFLERLALKGPGIDVAN